ncbi:MAG: glycerol-3-phosphate responsive antiterminator [Clostridiales bacterium]|nr:glycerol-3-phosphate responsive antiterminator [Clostridiales bacterium]
MEQRFYDAVMANPIIAAVKDDKGLQGCLRRREIRVVFILYGDICSIADIVAAVQNAGKIALVHADLIYGLSPKEIAVDFLQQNAGVDGIISTHQNLIMRARELRMYTVLRVFILDSMSLAEAGSMSSVGPDFLEILPGVMPDIIRRLHAATKIPLLAGGLIDSKKDAIGALDAGATAISTTNEAVWEM